VPAGAGGVLLVDKPAGVTSHDVVARVRRELGGGRRGPKVGHAGTLDPFATGLLLVLVGRATRAQRFLMGLPKAYEVVARLGAASSTGDVEGEIVETGRLPPDPLPLPTGRLRQRPPAYSAVHVGGERAYARARRGEAVELPEREVVVHAFEQRSREGDRAELYVECSAGTYVRALVADLGDAYCEALRRVRIGPFDVAGAGGPPVPLEDALAFLPAVALRGDRARAAGHGRAVPGEAEGPVRLLDERGLVAVAEPRRDASGPVLKPVVGFRDQAVG
jgi:tRNA pseudouridine55 synthase